MKRQKRLTKKERKQVEGARPRTAAASRGHHHHHHHHIHCIACGKHLDTEIFGEPDGADFMRCEHGDDFPHCVACVDKAKALIEEHDRTNAPVAIAPAWH